MMTDDDTLRYDKMVENALRGVVRDAVQEVVDNGLPGDHHFYITFLTEHPDVDIPDYLKERYPGEMTIVLQYQFSGLSIDDEFLRVTLSFNNQPEKLVVPLAAVSIFADPSVNFALQFQPLGEEIDGDDFPPEDDEGAEKKSKKKKSPKKDKEKTGEVVSLDNFRKK